QVIEDDPRAVKRRRLPGTRHHLALMVSPERGLSPRTSLTVDCQPDSGTQQLHQLLEETDPIRIQSGRYHHVDVRPLFPFSLALVGSPMHSRIKALRQIVRIQAELLSHQVDQHRLLRKISIVRAGENVSAVKIDDCIRVDLNNWDARSLPLQ